MSESFSYSDLEVICAHLRGCAEDAGFDQHERDAIEFALNAVQPSMAEWRQLVQELSEWYEAAHDEYVDQLCEDPEDQEYPIWDRYLSEAQRLQLSMDAALRVAEGILRRSAHPIGVDLDAVLADAYVDRAAFEPF